tara:strand:+ start:3738 stop:4394 length:657 start_codon:yes stop_codon:yes gene_type:complete
MAIPGFEAFTPSHYSEILSANAINAFGLALGKKLNKTKEERLTERADRLENRKSTPRREVRLQKQKAKLANEQKNNSEAPVEMSSPLNFNLAAILGSSKFGAIKAGLMSGKAGKGNRHTFNEMQTAITANTEAIQNLTSEEEPGLQMPQDNVPVVDPVLEQYNNNQQFNQNFNPDTQAAAAGMMGVGVENSYDRAIMPPAMVKPDDVGVQSLYKNKIV